MPRVCDPLALLLVNRESNYTDAIDAALSDDADQDLRDPPLRQERSHRSKALPVFFAQTAPLGVRSMRHGAPTDLLAWLKSLRLFRLCRGQLPREDALRRGSPVAHRHNP